MYPLYRWTSIGLAVMLLSGCATRKTRTSQLRFQGPKKAAVNEAASESLSDYMTKVRHLSANARPLNKNEAAESLETRDPAIAAELLQVSSQPTAERYRNLAEHYRERGVLDAAYRHFNRAIALNPRDGAAYEGLARVWRDWGLPQLAVGDAHRAIYYAPQMASARNTFGTVMQALGYYDEARAAYELANRLEPDAAYPVNNLCYLAFLQGHVDAAIETCKKALEVDPSMRAAKNNLALAFAASGRVDLAQSQFIATSGRASGLYNTGLVHLAAGDKAAALHAFDEATKARPTFHLARERAKQIRAELFLANRQERLKNQSNTPDRPTGAFGQ
ncbi:MAG TPA: tetratricopeptide repeat protein [Vicinamibacterales bacterium]|nr:tetratricopeptide repeat protein [Vicinamibacterales bacterium]